MKRPEPLPLAVAVVLLCCPWCGTKLQGPAQQQQGACNLHRDLDPILSAYYAGGELAS